MFRRNGQERTEISRWQARQEGDMGRPGAYGKQHLGYTAGYRYGPAIRLGPAAGVVISVRLIPLLWLSLWVEAELLPQILLRTLYMLGEPLP